MMLRRPSPTIALIVIASRMKGNESWTSAMRMSAAEGQRSTNPATSASNPPTTAVRAARSAVSVKPIPSHFFIEGGARPRPPGCVSRASPRPCPGGTAHADHPVARCGPVRPSESRRPSSSQAYARVEPAVDQIDRQVDERVHQRAEEDRGEDDGEIADDERLDRAPPEARPRQQRLRDRGPAP